MPHPTASTDPSPPPPDTPAGAQDAPASKEVVVVPDMGEVRIDLDRAWPAPERDRAIHERRPLPTVPDPPPPRKLP